MLTAFDWQVVPARIGTLVVTRPALKLAKVLSVAQKLLEPLQFATRSPKMTVFEVPSWKVAG